MPASTDDQKRFARYSRVVEAAASQDTFTLADVKHVCAEERAAFVTQIVGKLAADGILKRSGTKSNPQFQWDANRDKFSAVQWIDSKIYNNRIKLAPIDERPRERLLSQGPQALRLADLLAILISAGRGGDSALQAGEKIAARFSDRLDELTHAGRGELKHITPAVGNAVYCQIMAGIELGRRVVQANESRRSAKIGGSRDAIEFCQHKFARLAADGAQEEFHIVTLDTKNQTINTHRISLGALDQTIVHPREVFRAAIKDAAKSIVLVHNHPSGDPTPSEQDRAVTARLEEAGQIVGIQVLDHIIVARNGAVSLQEVGS